MVIQPTLIVHGGAGKISDDLQAPYREGVRRAAYSAWEILSANGSALDAVEAAVRLMEDDPAFDAGLGSHLNLDGVVEMDALIMDGATLRNGAIAAVQRIANPITLARLVMVNCGHSLLVGSGAERFAEQMGTVLTEPESLVAQREFDRWKESVHESTGVSDTVGAVARDASGNIAVATSTGGTLNKLPGRVGDSPLIGCGAYADNLLGGASATGKGEDLMKVVMCKLTCDLMGSGLNAQAAADEAVRRLADPRVKGYGGVIALDIKGGVGVAYSTPHLARAIVRPDGTITAEL